MAKEPTKCECGCGADTKGGKFNPGHDAKHKSNLIEQAIAGSEDAKAELRTRGWGKFLTKKVETLKAAEKRAAEKAKAKEQRAKDAAKAKAEKKAKEPAEAAA